MASKGKKGGGGGDKTECVKVAVRLRPLNRREREENQVSWYHHCHIISSIISLYHFLALSLSCRYLIKQLLCVGHSVETDSIRGSVSTIPLFLLLTTTFDDRLFLCEMNNHINMY
jgi:hypothetical protein